MHVLGIIERQRQRKQVNYTHVCLCDYLIH